MVLLVLVETLGQLVLVVALELLAHVVQMVEMVVQELREKGVLLVPLARGDLMVRMAVMV